MNNKKIFERIITEKRAKSSNERPKYGLRKLTVGVVSCLLGYMMFFTPNVVAAEKVDQPQAVEATVESTEVANVENVEEKSVESTETEQPASHVQAYSSQATETNAQDRSVKATAEDVKEEFKLSDAQLKELKEAGFDEEQIQKIENDIKLELEKDPSYDVEKHIKDAIGKLNQPELELAPEAPKTGVRDAAAPEETTTSADAKNAFHGFVGVQSSGDLNLNLEKAYGEEFTPIEGVKVYFQWFEDGGYVSPTYTTVSGPDGRINMEIKPFLAADGKIIKFDADTTVSGGNERYRFWVDESTIPEGYQLQYVTGENVVMPANNAGLPITQGGSSSSTIQNTHNNWKVLLMKKPEAEMHKDATESEPKADGGFVEETVGYDYKSGVGGVQWKTVADLTSPAEGVTVKASYLSDYALKQIYSEDTVARMSLKSVDDIRGSGWTKALETQLQEWIKTQIAKEPDKWIAETVSAKTNAEGKYLIQFKGIWGDYKNADAGKKEYTYKVGDNSSGQIWNKWTDEQIARLGQVADSAKDGGFTTSATTNQKKHVNYDWLFVSVEGAENLRVMTPYNNNQYTLMHNTYGIHSGWSGIGFSTGVSNATNSALRADFALAPTEIKFNIVNYDAGANTARPGDVAKTSTQGLPYSNTSDSFRIVWYDEKGTEVKSEDISKPNSLGALPEATLDTSGVTEEKLYTAKLYRVDSKGKNAQLLAVDSFAVIVDRYIGSVYDDFTHDIKGTKDATFSAQGLPDGLEINDQTGVISGKPTKAGKYDVTTTTTINDESGDLSASRTYRYLITDSPVPEGMVGKQYNQTVNPTAVDGYVFKNVSAKFIDGKSISGLNITGDKISGTPTVKVEATQEDPNVEVTYDVYRLNDKGEEVLIKEKHVDKVPLVIKQADQATSYDPHYEQTPAKVGEKVTTSVPSFTDLDNAPTPLPEGVTFELGTNPPANASVDSLTGAVTYTPSEEDADKTINVPVKVVYNDGTFDEVVAPIIVTKTPDADKYEPTVEKEEIEKGGKVDLTDNVTNLDELPEGTKVEDVTPEGTIDTNTPGDYTGKIKVTYPDGSSEEKDVPVTVKDTTPSKEDTKVTGDVNPVDPTDEKQDTGINVENKDEDTKVTAKDEDGKDVPVEIDENGNVIVTPGTDVDGPITVVVEDPDLPGGKVEIEVPVNGHEKGRDDNGSDKDGKTTVDDS
ncbi:MAG: Rib/alpha-like domain-containing protein, partial [Finegoldia magna]|nr:Rib/alpha-like domain-containing protein [Finegoldia magna]